MRYHGNKICPDEHRNVADRQPKNIMLLLLGNTALVTSRCLTSRGAAYSRAIRRSHLCNRQWAVCP